MVIEIRAPRDGEGFAKWRVNDGGAIVSAAEDFAVRITLAGFAQTPVFKQCVLEHNYRVFYPAGR